MDFREKLREIINCHSMEGGSDTPDHILADYLVNSLAAFDAATQHRDDFRGAVKDAAVTQTEREQGSRMTIQTALALYYAGHSWLREEVDTGRDCHCGSCHLCAYRYLESLAAAGDAILGWREIDWPEGFDRRTAEMMADLFREKRA